MAHITLEELKKLATEVSDDLLNKSFLKGGLKLSDEEVNTLSFAYGLCYLAERDIGEMIPSVLETLTKSEPPEVVERLKTILNEYLNREVAQVPELEDALKDVDQGKANEIRRVVRGRYDRKPTIKVEKLRTFGEKIFAYEQLFFENNVVQVLREIKKVRNDISHVSTIEELSYKGESLMLRKTKEKALIEYFEAVFNPDHSHSDFQTNVKLAEDEDPRVVALLQAMQ